jgi:hypothetical protein
MNANLVTDAKYALVIAERKEFRSALGTEPTRQWLDFLGNVQRTADSPSGTQKIHENVWLLPLATGLPFLGKLVDWSGSFEVSIRILFLEEVPNWIEYPPTKKTASESEP